MLSKYEDYGSIQQEIHVRVTNLPVIDSLRELRHVHLGVLIKVIGVVTRRTGVFPQLKISHFNCGKCGSVIGPFSNVGDKEIEISMCPECQANGPFSLNSEQTVYRNFQKVTLQESPGTVPAGRVPRHKEVILLADLVDSVRFPHTPSLPFHPLLAQIFAFPWVVTALSPRGPYQARTKPAGR